MTAEDNYFFEEETKEPASKAKWYWIGGVLLIIVIVLLVTMDSTPQSYVPSEATSQYSCIAKNVTYDCNAMDENLKSEVLNGAYHPFCICQQKTKSP